MTKLANKAISLGQPIAVFARTPMRSFLRDSTTQVVYAMFPAGH